MTTVASILRGISVAYGLRAKNGKPYSDERNYTVIIGLQAEFRDLVEGKGEMPAAVEPAACVQGGAAKITVMSDAAPSSQSEALGSFASALRVRPRSDARPQSRKGESQMCGAGQRTETRRSAARERKPRLHAEERHELQDLLHL